MADEFDDADDAVDVGALVDGERPLRELAVAIRRAPPGPWRDDAEHWLDRITYELGSEAQEQVEQARHSPEARRAPGANPSHRHPTGGMEPKANISPVGGDSAEGGRHQ